VHGKKKTNLIRDFKEEKLKFQAFILIEKKGEEKFIGKV
jgi:hypothetical protein